MQPVRIESDQPECDGYLCYGFVVQCRDRGRVRRGWAVRAIARRRQRHDHDCQGHSALGGLRAARLWVAQRVAFAAIDAHRAAETAADLERRLDDGVAGKARRNRFEIRDFAG